MAILLTAGLSYLAWLFLEISYNIDGFTNEMLGFFWGIFSSLFAGDLIEEMILFAFVGLGMFGTVLLSRQREKRVWAIVSFMMTILSLLGLFMTNN